LAEGIPTGGPMQREGWLTVEVARASGPIGSGKREGSGSWVSTDEGGSRRRNLFLFSWFYNYIW
jgi:hypothetical protein